MAKEYFLVTVYDRHVDDHYSLFSDPANALKFAMNKIKQTATDQGYELDEIEDWTPKNWVYAAGFGEGYNITVRGIKLNE